MKYDGWLIKSGSRWVCVLKGQTYRFNWKTPELQKAEGDKKFYSAEEVKAKGMRWVTIRGARVLLQGTSDGGWVVVGGAGGKLNHYKVDRLLDKETYEKRVEARKKNKKEETRKLTDADKKKRTQDKQEIQAIRKEAKKQYKTTVSEILKDAGEGKTGGLEDSLNAKTLEQIRIEANKRVAKKGKVTDEAVEKEVEVLTEQATTKKAREKVQEARETLASMFLGDIEDPNKVTDPDKVLMSEDTAMKIMQANRNLKEVMKTTKRDQIDNEARLKVGEAFAGKLPPDTQGIMDQIRNDIETAENIGLYDRVNVKGDKIQKHIDIGASRALNGILSSMYEQGAMFDAKMVSELGIEAMTRAIANKLQMDDKSDIAKKALTEYSNKIRRDTVIKAMEESELALDKSKAMFSLADEAEGIPLFDKAVANGKSARFYTKSSAELGGAVGSLRAMAHTINALEDPPNKTIQVDSGRDIVKAHRKMARAGLDTSMYELKKDQFGRIVAEIDADHLTPIFEKSVEAVARDKHLSNIKLHKMNTGKVSEGIQEGYGWMGDAQEAGYLFAKERKKVLLDFKPGLGKTFIAGNAIADGLNSGMKKILVAVPATLKEQFENEMIDHTVIDSDGKEVLKKGFLTPELQKKIYRAGDRLKPKDRRAFLRKQGVHIVSHTALQNDREAIHKQKWDMIIADEVHDLVNAKKGDANSKSYDSLAELSKGTDRLIAMTGTPVKTHKREMWKLGNLVDPQYVENTLGTMDAFEKRHLGINQTTSAFANEEMEAFRSENAEFTFSQGNKLDVKHTKTKTDVKINNEQRKAIRDIEAEYKKRMTIEGRPIDPKTGKPEKLANQSGWRDSQLWQITHLTGGENNPKYQAIVKDIQENREGQRGLLFMSQGVSVKGSMQYANQLNSTFGEGSAIAVTSKMKSHQLDALKQRINAKNPDDPLRFLIGTTTLATGHNIQGAEFIHHVDVPMSKSQAEQQEARAYRKGQTSDVTTVSFYSNDPNDISKRNNLETKGKESDIVGNPASVAGLAEGGFGSHVQAIQDNKHAEVA